MPPSDSSGARPAPGIGRTVAIMQPYFIPYTGYFRLFAAADLFVLYDCVQFPRRGWLHRNMLRDSRGEQHWLTLPLQKAAREVLIRDLAFRDDAADEMEEQFRRFPALAAAPAALMRELRDLSGTPLDHIERTLRFAATTLGLPWRVLRSSRLDIDPAIRGQDRILAIAARLGAGCYVNPSGGRALYQAERFEAAGMALRFLPPHEGSYDSIAERLATQDASAIAAEVLAGTRLVP